MFMSLLYVIFFVRGWWAFDPLSCRIIDLVVYVLQVSLFIDEGCLSSNDSPRQLHIVLGRILRESKVLDFRKH
jgi:hypothetical protein